MVKGLDSIPSGACQAPEGQTRQSLTSYLLSSLPQRDSNRYLLDYINGQQQLVLQGRAASPGNTVFLRSSDECATVTALNLPTANEHAGNASIDIAEHLVAGTPVLKARTNGLNKAMRGGIHLDLLIPPSEKLVDDTPRDQVDVPSVSEPTPKRNDRLRGNQKDRREFGKKKTKTSDENVHSDHEQADRLEERRQRKRQKKTIMSPHVAKEKERKQRLKEKKVPSAQVDFALMHGFSATNVGKNRLTLDPLRPVGVFKKGKASKKIASKDGVKQGSGAFYFSESKLLNSGRVSPAGRSEHSSVVQPAIPIDYSLAIRSTAESQGPSQLPLRAKGGEPELVQLQQPRTPYNPEDSIIWDIEKESVATFKSDTESDAYRATVLVRLPSKIYANVLSPKLLDEPHDPSCKLDPGLRGGSHEPTADLADDTLGSSSSSSVTPSQSASQVRREAIAPSLKLTTTSVAQKPVENLHACQRECDVSQHSPPALNILRNGEDEFHLLKEETDPAVHSPFFQMCIQSDIRPSLTACTDLFPGLVASDEIANYYSVDKEFPVCSGILDHSDWYTGFGAASDEFSFHSDEQIGLFDAWQGEDPCIVEGNYELTDVDSRLYGSDFDPSGCLLSQDSIGCSACSLQGASVHPCSHKLESSVLDIGQDIQNQPSALDYSEESMYPDVQEEDGHQNDDWNDCIGFYQGPCLLYGLDSMQGRPSSLQLQPLSHAEAEVAVLMNQNHWLPQRL